ncbi:hypothetical protein WDW89_23950 [Deltaproteobacteria bacterium TL4]
MERNLRFLKTLFSSPFTWLVLLSLLGWEWGFMAWFQPPWIVKLPLAFVGFALMFLWPVLFLKSAEFREQFNRMPYEEELEDLETLLEHCPQNFNIPTKESLILVQKIKAEFKERAYVAELSNILVNLTQLSKNHYQLYTRSQYFGTKQQKHAMLGLLNQQVHSVQTSLNDLRTLSGHLTLIEAQSELDENMEKTLKAINQGLSDAIQEIYEEAK